MPRHIKMTNPSHNRNVKIIRSTHGLASLDLKELWDYRELLYFLIWRDVKLRYKQTALGASWAIIQPFTMMIVFSIIFGGLAGLPSEDIPYPIFTYTALMPWAFFAGALGRSSDSVVGNSALITRVYVPRLMVPLSGIIVGLFDFAIALIILVGLMAFYGITPTIGILMLPIFLLMAMATAMSVGLWLSAINTRFRDVRLGIPFLTQVWLFATPVAYSGTLIPENWKILYSLNPMTTVVDGFRWALLGTNWQPDILMAISVIIVIITLISGAFYFQRMGKSFADVV